MKKKNTDILKKAIAELPEFRLNNPEIWPRIEDVLRKESKFSVKLPEYKAPEGLWNTIEERLNQQVPQLNNAINDLPEQKAPEKIWKNIENELDKTILFRQKKLIPWIIRISAAAVITILVGYFSITWIVETSRRKTFFSNSKTVESKEEGFESIYNPALCKSNPQVCSTDLFKSLDNQLNDIKSEIESMKPLIKGNDPQLLKYYYRLENERAEIEKRLVKIIMQS